MSIATLESITVTRENWEQCALAAGDNNPIHFEDFLKFNVPKPICPGVYLFSLAEALARKNQFEIPMHVKAQFNDPVYENQNLKIKQEKYDEGLSIYFVRENSKVAEFNFTRSLNTYMNFETSSRFETFTGEISSRDLSQFNYALGLGNNNEIYFTFVLGRVLKYFLNDPISNKNRHGALLTKVEFDFFREVSLGEINVELFVIDDVKIKRNFINHKYEVNGSVAQNGELIGFGKGVGSYKEQRT